MLLFTLIHRSMSVPPCKRMNPDVHGTLGRLVRCTPAHTTATKGDAHMLSVMIRPSKTRVVYAGRAPDATDKFTLIGRGVITCQICQNIWFLRNLPVTNGSLKNSTSVTRRTRTSWTIHGGPFLRPSIRRWEAPVPLVQLLLRHPLYLLHL